MATVSDVARVAGVSAKTVGRVLNGDAPVGPATRANVERAMDELGYVPSSAARMPRSNRSRLIGVVSGAIADSCQEPEAAGLPETHILRGIQDVADDTGHTMPVSDTGGRSGPRGRADPHLHRASRGRHRRRRVLPPEGRAGRGQTHPGLIPSTPSAAAMTENYAEGGPLEVFFDLSREQALVRPVTPGYVVAAKVFEKALADIANGADVADTLDAAVDEIEADIARNGGYGHEG